MMNIQTRALGAPARDGKPAWWGQYRRHENASWQNVVNDDGEPIAYASPEAARDGARQVASICGCALTTC